VAKLVEPDKVELISAINASVQELQQGIDTHRCLLSSILEQQMDKDSYRQLMAACPSRRREGAMKDAIQETIEVLEESRKAFKSKKLEILRKKLIKVLIDAV
jgi:hypothetical protein